MSNINEPSSVDRPAQGGGQGNLNNAQTGSLQPGRKLVLFADGTGNAFTTQESNVWRLYEALDRTQPDQVVYYIKGVGTAGWAPLAALDGATGIGVPSNVRKLYRFLCWNWQPGDEIYIFGFSRGSFTARTLTALIASQGLVPAIIDGVPVSHGEMQRNSMAAWREYRRHTVPWYKSLPTIPIMRVIRDIILAVYHFILRHRSYSKVRAAMDHQRKVVPIKFLGLFDTVEAYGVPIEELRTAIDWAIWPISFRNRELSHHVECARHALSLDDDRTAFHPIRFDQSDPKNAERIKEVWFAGVHSDVGGGYPDGTLSYVPLVWMAEQVEQDLRFQPGQIDHFRAYQSAIGPRHDSRTGAATIYRYGPRPIGESKADGGPPVVDLSVVERMLHGCDDYAPITLPASAKVLLNDGKVMPLTADETRGAMKSAYQTSPRGQNPPAATAAEAFETMPPPDANMAEQVLDTVWWRRFAYFSLLGAIALLVVWPWVAETVVGWLKSPADSVKTGGTSLLAIVTLLDYALNAVIRPVAGLLKGFLPSYAEPWLDIALYYPVMTTVIAILAFAAWNLNAFLRDRVQERARLAWYQPNRKVAALGKPNPLLKIGRFMRLHGWPLRFLFAKVLLPLVFLVAIFGLAFLAAGRSYFNWRMGTGELCANSKDPVIVGEKVVKTPATFDTSKLCWASGVQVEKGRKYRIWITMQDPWFDRTIMSGLNGFTYGGHTWALPLRRVYAADWFQPVVRIGNAGADELPLQAVNAMPADKLPRHVADSAKTALPIRVEETSKFGAFEPIPKDALPAAQATWRKQGLADSLVADFVAPESGELFLYVNDAIQVFPLLGPFDLFYKNNSGTAQVEIQRVPMPPPEK